MERQDYKPLYLSDEHIPEKQIAGMLSRYASATKTAIEEYYKRKYPKKQLQYKNYPKSLKYMLDMLGHITEQGTKIYQTGNDFATTYEGQHALVSTLANVAAFAKTLIEYEKDEAIVPLQNSPDTARRTNEEIWENLQLTKEGLEGLYKGTARLLYELAFILKEKTVNPYKSPDAQSAFRNMICALAQKSDPGIADDPRIVIDYYFDKLKSATNFFLLQKNDARKAAGLPADASVSKLLAEIPNNLDRQTSTFQHVPFVPRK